MALGAPEAVPAAGGTPTVAEVATWASGKLGLVTTRLRAEPLGASVAANDWIDTEGVRHVRLEQYVPSCDCM